MKKTLLMYLCILGTSYAIAQDNCASAYPILPGSYFVDAISGAQVPNPVCSEGGSGATAGMWYSYTPTANHNVTITTDLPINTGKNTRFQIYRGNCADLICSGGDDDSGSGNLSADTFSAQLGMTYYIVFDNRWSSQGFTFQLIEGPFVIIPAEAAIGYTTQTINFSNSECIVDMNNDYLDDIVGVNNSNINVASQSNAPGGFTYGTIPTPTAAYMPGWSIAAGDIDNNGYTDLLYASGNGVAFMKQNDTGTGFTQMYSSQNVFSQRSNFVDINNDGDLDAFVCHDVAPNVYYLNDGAGNYTFHQGGLGDFPSGGNYGSIWIDYDNDGDMDLFIAKCRGGNSGANIDELHRNDGNGVFTDVSIAANLAEPSQSWSSAWADYDNDGDMDVFIGASSFQTGGHKLMRNNNDGTFTDITAGSGFDLFTPTNIENVAHDFNNDGYVDIFAGNRTVMVNNGSMNFSPFQIAPTHGPMGDVNNDGFLDILNGNVLYLHTGNTNNWIKVLLQGVESNRSGIGARVEIYGSWGKQIRDVRSGDGFAYMSSLNTHFGIGQASLIEKVVVKWPSGTVDTILNPAINTPLFVLEGATLSVNDVSASGFMVYPNPADDVLHIKLGSNSKSQIRNAEIFDLSGRKVLDSEVTNQSVSVKKLSTGTYILLLKDTDGKPYSQKFLKK